MSYTPTDWNNDAAPAINATNLDKIEQGIADAHTTADAAIAKAILDAAGDLVSASAADTPARLALGSNDEVLSVNSSALDYRKVVNAMVDDAAAVAYSKLNLATSIVNADIAVAAAIAYSKLNLAASIVNADVNASAAIAYSKLNLAGSIVNADIGAAAAIAYSKLNLAGSIVNADIGAAAAIAYSKLNLTNEIVNTDIDDSAAIAYSKLALTDSIVDGDINSSAAIALSKLASVAWTGYTPTLTVDVLGTNPTLGTGSSATGAYTKIGRLVIGDARIAFGSSGTDAGSGNYVVSLPVTAAALTRVHGTCLLTNTGVDNVIGLLTGFSTTGTYMIPEAGVIVTHAAPFAWGADDEIKISFVYESAA